MDIEVNEGAQPDVGNRFVSVILPTCDTGSVSVVLQTQILRDVASAPEQLSFLHNGSLIEVQCRCPAFVFHAANFEEAGGGQAGVGKYCNGPWKRSSV